MILPICDSCKQWKWNVKPRSDWAPPRPLCDECYQKWWDANKDELG